MNYLKQANDFAAKYGVKLEVVNEYYGFHFHDDKQKRQVFEMELSRNGKSYTFAFGQSIANAGEVPTMYDILACLTKYEVGSFDDFCADYGYNDLPPSEYDRINALYEAVREEFEAVQRLFGDVIEELQEIS
jgi:hypothetical protein